MSHDNIIRAWKNEAFRNSLSEEERALLPEHPAGLIELTDAQLGAAAGAQGTWTKPLRCDPPYTDPEIDRCGGGGDGCGAGTANCTLQIPCC
jgi:mersacidin/lichenicidin family type 2 lantibiotic